MQLQTERIRLRRWKESDIELLVALNRDPRVMEFYPAVKTREETIAEYRGFQEGFASHGFCFFAVELIDTGVFIGMLGLRKITEGLPFAPTVEIGWKLAFEYWGKGYATEGALLSLEYGFQELGLEEIVSFTATCNKRSMAVMERIGMQRDLSGDFDHPKIPERSHLRRHVLYRLSREKWQKQRGKRC